MPAVVKKSPSEKIQDEAQDVTDALASVDLSDAPKLKPYRALRVRERAAIMAVFDKLDVNESDDPDMVGQYLQLAEMDEALEKVALDPAVYADWAVGDEPEVRITALFMRYAEQVGESMRSAS